LFDFYGPSVASTMPEIGLISPDEFGQQLAQIVEAGSVR
jgi:hypothetical protein